MNDQKRFRKAMDEIPVPVEKVDAILINAFEVKKWKRSTLGQIAKYSGVVAVLCVCLISTAHVSPTFANWATRIPGIGHAFEHFILQEDYYKAYEEISTDIGAISIDNGVELIIEKAFYDGNSVTLSFLVRNEHHLEEAPEFERFPSVKNDRGQNGSGYVGEYVDGIGFVGMMTLDGLSKDTVNVSWKPESISWDKKKIKGNWEFAFSLDALEGTHLLIDRQVSKDGVTVKLIDATKTDVNLTINYLQDVQPSVHDKWMAVEAELFAIDNLGNEYKVPYNGGSGTNGGDSSEDITWNATIHGLDPQATSITFYPFANLSNSQHDSVKIDFDPIVVELE